MFQFMPLREGRPEVHSLTVPFSIVSIHAPRVRGDGVYRELR